ILLCPLHHGFVDKKELEAEYPTVLLRGYKKAHEDHVRAMTGTERKDRTTALRMVGQIRDHLVAISDADVRSAVFAHEERYVDEIIDIDIGTIPDAAGSAYIETARTKILSELRYRILPQIQDGTIRRLSVFALSRIPLLCELGYGIGDKVDVELYQHHRAPIEGWKWQPNGARVPFEIVEHVRGDDCDASRVAVLLAVSGGDVEKIQGSSRAKSVYVVRPSGVDPTRTLVSSPTTLEEFRSAYQGLLSRIEKEHRHAVGVDLFLAAPAPVAFIAGRDVARDVVPDVVIHDLVNGQYVAVSVLKTRTAVAFAPSERAPVVTPSLS
ncbi:MAG: SAVED domain-containing protein, partial [Deltaproteobacteria bacterium]|nr:SAVED domain-containing protein [Deltaproteobacteria bacterium]